MRPSTCARVCSRAWSVPPSRVSAYTAGCEVLSPAELLTRRWARCTTSKKEGGHRDFQKSILPRAICVVFPSSSSLNGHPGRPGKRAAGGRGRPGARGPGRGPTVVWAQPGCLGAFSCRAPPRSQLEIGWLLTLFVATQTTNESVTARRLRACCTGVLRRRAALPAPPGPPSDRPPQSASVEEVSRLA